MTFTGIAASPGIGVGPVVRFEPEEIAVRETRIPPERVEPEIERLRAALTDARRDLLSIRDRIAAELGEPEAAIYDAHLLILDDPELKRSVEETIRAERRAAAGVFRDYMSRVAAFLEKIEDDHLREKRADVLDVERRVLRLLLGGGPQWLDTLKQPAVLVCHELAPSDAALLDRRRVLGFVTEVGSRTSHFAIVARGRGIPAVVSARGVMQHVRTGDLGAVDGFLGTFELNPDEAEQARYRAGVERVERQERELLLLRDQPAVTTDGHVLELGANIELPGEAEAVMASGADSVGLFRTEFFYLNRFELPTEDEQYRAYRGVVEMLAPRPVIFRTMDLGGDKVASYLGMTHETNPFMGWRGIRFALQHPEVFRTQLRAIYRASAHGRVRMMFPMVSTETELLHTLQLCSEVRAQLDAFGQPYDRELAPGIMIETPSAVWMADVLARHASFFSIGSNDLTQYTLAMDRDNERLAHLYDPLEPAVLRSIQHTIDAARGAGRWVGVCGEMAGDPLVAVLLLGMGVDELSMSTFDLPRVKAAIRAVHHADARKIAVRVLGCASAAAVKRMLRDGIEPKLPAFLRTREGDGE